MKMSLTSVVIFAAGVILMYSAIKNKDPRDVVREALGAKKTGTSRPISLPTNDQGSVSLIPTTPVNPNPPGQVTVSV